MVNRTLTVNENVLFCFLIERDGGEGQVQLMGDGDSMLGEVKCVGWLMGKGLAREIKMKCFLCIQQVCRVCEG